MPLTGAANLDDEANFYRNFTALELAGLDEGGALRAEFVNRLQELVDDNVGGQGILLFDRLCRIAREGAANAAKWTRLGDHGHSDNVPKSGHCLGRSIKIELVVADQNHAGSDLLTKFSGETVEIRGKFLVVGG